MIYRKYKALLSDATRITIAFTFDDLWDGSDASAQARARGAVAYGQILISGRAEGDTALTWMHDGLVVHIATDGWMDAVRPEVREAIGSYLSHFLETVRQEIEVAIRELRRH